MNVLVMRFRVTTNLLFNGNRTHVGFSRLLELPGVAAGVVPLFSRRLPRAFNHNVEHLWISITTHRRKVRLHVVDMK